MTGIALLIFSLLKGAAAASLDEPTDIGFNRLQAPAYNRVYLYPIPTRTLTDKEFLLGQEGLPAMIAAELKLPIGAAGRLPAVILMHGSGGTGPNTERWVEEFTKLGIATVIVDSYGGRGISETITDQSRLGILTQIVDAYRVLEQISRHPQIDSHRVALMGFSRGGVVALYAAMERFQRLHGSRNANFAAYLPFYPYCNGSYREDGKLDGAPVRIFHGAADDWVPVDPCRRYMERLRQSGQDVLLTEYPGAYHAFDFHNFPARMKLPNAQNPTRCFQVEGENGDILNVETGLPFKWTDACVTLGATVGYQARAHAESIKAVTNFLADVFHLLPRVAQPLATR